MMRLLIAIAVLAAILLSAYGHALEESGYKAATAGIDLSMCRAVHEYEETLQFEGRTIASRNLVNDFPFPVSLIWSVNGVWKSSKIEAGGQIEVTTTNDAAITVVDRSIGMCIGVYTAVAKEAKSTIQLGQKIEDFNGKQKIAETGRQPEVPQSSADIACPEFVSGRSGNGQLIMDIGQISGEMAPSYAKVCLEKLDYLPLDILSDVSRGNVRGTMTFITFYQAADACALMDKEQSAKLERGITEVSAGQIAMYQAVESDRKKGVTQWDRGSENFNFFIEKTVWAATNYPSLVDEFDTVVQKPEWTGDCMCEQLKHCNK